MSDQAFDENILIWRAKGRVGAVLREKWRLDRLLGVGGMAAVYAGTHRNGKRGAVKVLHLELSMHPDARARFLQEGYVANRVDHPGAVSVLDDDVAEDGSVFLVMELLDGRTLEEVAASRPGRRLGAAEGLAIVDQLLDVLAAAHDRGIVHRDLKPENLFLTREGRIKVLDFGLARVREVQGARLTKTGNAMGTPAFLPPEQAQGQWDQVDGRTDLWAVGATLFTLLTGRLVHEASNLNQLLLAAMTHSAPALRSVAPDTPKPVAAIVDRALAFERKARWEDARAMQRAVREARRALPPVDLAALLDAAPDSDRVDGPFEQSPTLLASAVSRDTPQPPAKRAWIAAAGVGAVFLAAVIAFVASREAPSDGSIAANGAQPTQPSIEAVAPPTQPAPTPVEPAPTQPELAPPAPAPEATASAAPPPDPRAKPVSGRTTANPILQRPSSSAAPSPGSTAPSPGSAAKDPFLKGFN